MERIPVENKTAMPIYVAGCMIPAGETRHFSKDQVPQQFWPAAVAPVAPPQEDRIAALLEHNVGTVVAALPALSKEEIERLGELEQTGQARKGVLSVVAEVLLKSAAAPEGAAPAEGAAPEGAAPEGAAPEGAPA